MKFDYAKRAFEKGKYAQAITLLNDCITVFKGSEKAEESLYLLALSHYENKDYLNSGAYFNRYYTRYPKGKYSELARFYCGYGYYLDSPEPQLDQSVTIKAIEELQGFLEYFPRSDKISIAQNAIFELQDKL
ncbi:MAG: outer membrane protein assembly factor BamD, partial [Muribaculaceae bacterium]|nr:outer membrane protein assembly factor BamD [Muribaculaceae bacterium]